ncbi:MAG: hypothetical protein ACLRMZ_25630 [Blautia marasmi]
MNYGEKDYIVNVSRETSEDENVETSDWMRQKMKIQQIIPVVMLPTATMRGNAADDNASSCDLTDEDTENTDDSSSTASTTLNQFNLILYTK